MSVLHHLRIPFPKVCGKVKVADVNVMNYNGKTRRSGRTGQIGRRPNWKRAVVTLAEGSIEII